MKRCPAGPGAVDAGQGCFGMPAFSARIGRVAQPDGVWRSVRTVVSTIRHAVSGMTGSPMSVVCKIEAGANRTGVTDAPIVKRVKAVRPGALVKAGQTLFLFIECR